MTFSQDFLHLGNHHHQIYLLVLLQIEFQDYIFLLENENFYFHEYQLVLFNELKVFIIRAGQDATPDGDFFGLEDDLFLLFAAKYKI